MSREKRRKGHLENLGVSWRIILRWIIKIYDTRALTEFIYLNIGTILGQL
jgi:hypothetical protein